MSSPDPKRGHHVINNGVRKTYRAIIEHFVKTFGCSYFHGNNYMNLVQQNLITDCVIRKKPLPDETDREIENTTVYIPRGKTHTNDKNAEDFGRANAFLLFKVTTLMRDICCSLKNRNKMPDDLDVKMGELRQFITNSLNRDVFVDERAKFLWEKEKGPAGAKRLENMIGEVEKMFRKIAGEDTIQLVIHWGQWAFRVSKGFDYNHLQ